MDNVEVHYGLVAFAGIYELLGASYSSQQSEMEAHAATIKSGVEGLRDPDTGLFLPYHGADISYIKTSKKRYDVTIIRGQYFLWLFPSDIISNDHRRQAIEYIESKYPDHETDNSLDKWIGLIPIYVLLFRYGDTARVSRAIEFIEKNIPIERMTLQDLAFYLAIKKRLAQQP
jgi:hypothetical protein